MPTLFFILGVRIKTGGFFIFVKKYSSFMGRNLKLLLFLFFFYCLNLNGQFLTPSLLSSTGGELENTSVSLSSSIGEIATETLAISELIQTQGFEQSGIRLVYYSFSGNVYAGDKLVTKGMVYLYKFDNSQKVELFDSVAITNNSYFFCYLTEGIYTVYCIPTGSESENYYPTWFVNKTHLNNANKIDLSSIVGSIDIHLVDKTTSVPGEIIQNEKPYFYPDPANDFINLFTEPGSVVYIYNCIGEIIQTEKITEYPQKLNLSFNPGIYLLKIFNQKSTINYQAILIKK